MKYKAVVFDLFETLITEWGHKKYTKNEMCADLGVERAVFDVYWNEKEQDRYTGQISFEDSLLYACHHCGKELDASTLAEVLDKRRKAKAVCFEFVLDEVYELLQYLRNSGIKTAIISNCSQEEMMGLPESKICQYFDEIILSYETHMKKPDACIYELAAVRLGVDLQECIFVGDGGSNELLGAKAVGMTAIQAKWYTNQLPIKRDSIEGFLVAEDPHQIIEYLLT